MKKCRYESQVEQWFDGQGPVSDELRRHMDQCPACTAFLAGLERLRSGAAAAASRAEVQSGQFPAFFRGIMDRMDAPVAGRRGRMWAVLSLAAAALVVAISAFLVITDGTGTVDATVVESCSSELEGATVTAYDTDEGVTTVWVTVTREDVW